MPYPNVIHNGRARSMVVVTVDPSPRGLTVLVRCWSPSHLFATCVRDLPQRARRWDKCARAWRVDPAHVDRLVDILVTNNFAVVDRRLGGAA